MPLISVSMSSLAFISALMYAILYPRRCLLYFVMLWISIDITFNLCLCVFVCRGLLRQSVPWAQAHLRRDR